MNPATPVFAITAASLIAVGCGGSPPPPPQNPPINGPIQPAAGSGNAADPASANVGGTPRAAAPSVAPESAADPGGHAPVVSTSRSGGDTPVNSGAGDAVPEQSKQ